MIYSNDKFISGSDRVDEIQSQLDKLGEIEDRLEEGLCELHHELRRVKDGLEREGGQSQELQNKAKILQKNIKLNLNEMKRVRQRQEQLVKQHDNK